LKPPSRLRYNRSQLNASVDHARLEPVTFLTNEQERYYARLKNSMEKQTYNYQNHLNKAFVPSKVRLSDKYGEEVSNEQKKIYDDLTNLPGLL
jgi:hypothetical protein